MLAHGTLTLLGCYITHKRQLQTDLGIQLHTPYTIQILSTQSISHWIIDTFNVLNNTVKLCHVLYHPKLSRV